MIRLLQALLALFLLLGAGCAAYRLGPPAGENGGSIYIAPVRNETLAPQIRPLLTEQLRRVFADSPQWTLAELARADFVLEVTIVESRQEVAATRPEDTGRGLSFESTYTARASLTGPDGSLRDLPEVVAHGLLFDTPGQPEVAYQALPSITQKLAEDILQRASTP